MALVGARPHQLTVTAGTSSIEPAIGHLSEVFGKRWRLHRREELVAGLISRLLVLLVRTAEVFKANALRAVCLIHLLLGKLNGIGEHATRRKRKQEPTPMLNLDCRLKPDRNRQSNCASILRAATATYLPDMAHPTV